MCEALIYITLWNFISDHNKHTKPWLKDQEAKRRCFLLSHLNHIHRKFCTIKSCIDFCNQLFFFLINSCLFLLAAQRLGLRTPFVGFVVVVVAGKGTFCQFFSSISFLATILIDVVGKGTFCYFFSNISFLTTLI